MCGVMLAVQSGSWGDAPCGVVVDVSSSTALLASYSSPVTATGWNPTSVGCTPVVRLVLCYYWLCRAVCGAMEHASIVSCESNIVLDHGCAFRVADWPDNQHWVLHSRSSLTSIVPKCQFASLSVLSDAVVNLAQLPLLLGWDVQVPFVINSPPPAASDAGHK